MSRYYDGGVEGLSGDVARWVFTKYLSTNRPVEEKLANVNSLPSVAGSHYRSAVHGGC